jgi:sigma-E factor negative regulatory protein RseA
MSPELEAKLSLLIDGELGPEEEAALRGELARSPELVRRLAELEAVDAALGALPARPVPPQLRAGLAERIRAEAVLRVERPPRRRAPRRWLAAAALASAAAALALVVLPKLRREEAPLAQAERAPVPPAPAAEVARPAPPVELAERPPPPAPAPRTEPVPAATDEPDIALADDLPVIEVLDVLAELGELEEVGSG